MKIKKFSAKTYKEALEMIKRELGDNALIISSDEKKGRDSCVEITAAIDYDNEFITKDYKLNLKTPQVKSKFSTTYLASIYQNSKDNIKEPQEASSERNNVKTPIKPFNHSDDIGLKKESFSKQSKSQLLSCLKEYSIREDFAISLCDKAENIDEIILLMKHQLKIKDISMNSKVIMMVGPTGVGKTTTLAKLSARALKEGKRVGIINLDSYRIGACEQIRIYARIMGVPLFIASDHHALKEGLKRFLRDRDVIFIDTMGRNPKDESYIKFLSDISYSNISIDLHLLLSANSDDEFMLSTYGYYKKLPISCIGFTKIDEAIRFGSLYNLLITSRKPLAYLTTGQKVPDDIGFPDMDELINIIFNKRLQTC